MPDADLKELKMPSIIDIHILKSHLSIPFDLSKAISDYGFSIDIEHKMDTENDQVLSTVDVTINPSEDKGTIVGEFKVGYQVLILGISKYSIKSTDGKLLIPDNVAEVLNGILYSTTRGIIFMEAKGTFMHSAILPVLDASKFSPRTA